MGLFSRETPSQDEYNERKRQVESDENVHITAEDVRSLGRDREKLYEMFHNRAEEGRRKLERMKKRGEKEAHKLNDQYDRLLEEMKEVASGDSEDKLKDAMQAIREFEKEKLGIERDKFGNDISGQEGE